MSSIELLILFSIWRIIDLFVIYNATRFIKYLGFFPYRDVILNSKLPFFISSLANFDGIHYIKIAQSGYHQFEQAFFPFYPLTIKFISSLFHLDYILSGLIISNISFLIGLFIFNEYLKITLKTRDSKLKTKKPILWTLVLLLAFPTSFYFGSVYTGGLFFLLFSAVLYISKQNFYVSTIIAAILASLTKFIGVFLFIPLLIPLVPKIKISLANKKIPVKYFFLIHPIILFLQIWYLF